MRVAIGLYVASASYIRSAWDGNAALTVTLHTSAYVPDRLAHTTVNDLTDELPTGGGYTVGGVVLTNPQTLVYTGATWPYDWSAGGVYEAGNIIRPTTPNGYIYRCAVGGVAALTRPVWPIRLGECVADGSVVWACAGSYVGSLKADNLTPAWSSFSAGPYRHMIISSRVDPDPALQPLFGVYTYTTDQQGVGDDMTVVFDPSGVTNVTIH